ncbi:DUF6378 domain-containing protein [Acetobacter thailandicus]|uniref:DUF6378 domain-containing protein n=1 Tax=Acetobacter thailandicus TaxID=1502842 RepID=UPI001BA7EED9|nr:DUF6378 domain-containing protein [Acetobacter thailandicus]MBS1003208.1 hypothetical protein [Acetobacter thailandicus]
MIDQNAADILDQAKAIVSGRRQTKNGAPERSFEHIAKRWSLTVGAEIKPPQVALMMADLKMVRLLEGITETGDESHAVDMCGYAAIAAELLKKEGRHG